MRAFWSKLKASNRFNIQSRAEYQLRMLKYLRRGPSNSGRWPHRTEKAMGLKANATVEAEARKEARLSVQPGAKPVAKPAARAKATRQTCRPIASRRQRCRQQPAVEPSVALAGAAAEAKAQARSLSGGRDNGKSFTVVAVCGTGRGCGCFSGGVWDRCGFR